MAERVIISRPLNAGCVGVDTISTKLRVTSTSYNGTVNVRLKYNASDSTQTVADNYDAALRAELVRVGIPNPVVIREDEIFGAERVIERTTRVEPHVEQRVVERTVVKYEPISGWLLLATGGIGGALGVAAKVAWVALFL